MAAASPRANICRKSAAFAGRGLDGADVLAAAFSAILAVGRRYADHAMAMTHQAFGPRVGVPRILGLLAD